MSNRKHISAGFIVDVGGEVGWGHYMRSHALAIELISGGVEVDFHTIGSIDRSPEDGFIVSSNGRDKLATIEYLSQKVNILVLDLYEFTSEVVNRAAIFPVSVCIDDTSSELFKCDLLVNPNLNSNFTHRMGKQTTYLIGGNHIILRQQFDHVPKRNCNREASHLFVAFGGTDPANLTQEITDILKRINHTQVQKITVLVGDASTQKKIKKQTRNDRRFLVIHNTKNVCALLREADIGIIAAGTMLYETAVTGLPCLVVSINESQKREALAFAENDAIIYLGDAQSLNKEKLLDGLNQLENLNTRQKIVKKCQSLIDGKGRIRVANKILELAENCLKEL